MQKLIHIYFIIVGVFFTSPVNSLADASIEVADSLFMAQKYTEACKTYENLYKEKGLFTPQSLIKLAHIKEVWGEHLEAIYYLNELYEYYPDKKVFNKMKELAERDHLEGYTYSDWEFFSTLYRKYQFEILISIMGIMVFLFLIVVANKIFIKGLSNRSPFLYMVLILVVAYFINIGYTVISPPKKIIMKDMAVVMDAPSPGSKVVTTLGKGRRVVVLDQIDIWYKINYSGKIGYIRKSNVLKS